MNDDALRAAARAMPRNATYLDRQLRRYALVRVYL